MLFGCKGSRGRIKIIPCPLLLKDFLHHIGCCTSRNILIDKQDPARLFYGFQNNVIQVKRNECLHIDKFRRDVMPGQLVHGFGSYPYC